MTKENIKLAIFDIDGTLIDRGKKLIEPSAIAAIERLKHNNIDVLIASGRPVYFAHDDIRTRIHPDYYVTINGSCVCDGDSNVLFSVVMDLDETNRLIRECRRLDLGIAMKMRDNIHVYNDLDIYRTVYMQGNPRLQHLVDCTQREMILPDEEIPMGMFVMGDEPTIESLAPLCPQAVLSKAYEHAYDIYPRASGKIKGIEFVLDQLGLNWDQVISFGDAHNDIEMIEKARIGVAMGNGIDELKKAADYVTTDILDHGIHNALKHYRLI